MKYVKPLKLYLQWRKELTNRRIIGLYLDNEALKVYSSSTSILGHAYFVEEWCRGSTNLHDKLQTFISKYNVMGLVLNYPHLRNTDIPYHAHTKILVADLCKTGRLEGLKYTYWNSSFWSKYEDDFGEREVNYRGVPPEAMPPRTDQKMWKMDRNHEMCLAGSLMLKGFIRCGVMMDGREKEFCFDP